MRRRAVLLVLVLGLALAPLARVVCESSCSPSTRPSAAHPVCHAQGGTAPVTLSAAHVHACDHVDRAVDQRAVDIVQTLPPASTSSLPLTIDRGIAHEPAVRTGSPPGSPASPLVLRI
jgi:hypothetical protein